MPVPLKRYLTVCLAVFMAISQAVAQPKAAGVAFSLSGFSAMYEHNVSED